jgi:hypothetical protein
MFLDIIIKIKRFLMSKIEQFSRIIHHRITGAGVPFTEPPSNDHTDSTWSETDLYIGEMGINLTDDKVFVRTNNGIVELATATGGSASEIWVSTVDGIGVGPTYSPDAIVRNTNSFVDLGTSTLRFKNLFLGGATGSQFGEIDFNQGMILKDANQNYISTINGGVGEEFIQFGTQSSSGAKTDKGLFIQSHSSKFTNGAGVRENRAIISTFDGEIEDCARAAIISGYEVKIKEGCDNTVYVGQGQFRDYDYSDSLAIGGQFIIRGIVDDGTSQYDRSEWITKQSRLRTVDALQTPIVEIDNFAGGEITYVKAHILAVDIFDPTLVYSCEMMAVYTYNGTTASIIGDPIIKEISSFSDEVVVEAITAPTYCTISVKGLGTNNIGWLCTYSYQKFVNVFTPI